MYNKTHMEEQKAPQGSSPVTPAAPTQIVDVVAPPKSSQPATDVDDGSEAAPPTQSGAETVAHQAPEAKKAAASARPKQTTAPVGTIIFALIIFIVLSTLAVLAYQKG